MNDKEVVYSDNNDLKELPYNEIDLDIDTLIIDETTIYEIDIECLKNRRF